MKLKSSARSEDIREHMVPRRLAAALAICGAMIASDVSATVTTSIDSFLVTRDGSTFFFDGFADGQVPPSSPSIPYSVGGTFNATDESGGKLQLNSAQGQPFQNASGHGRLSQSALLLTNTDSTNTTFGLKQNMTFGIYGLFDFGTLTAARDNFGIAASDRVGASGNEQLQVVIARSVEGDLFLTLLRQDFATNTLTTIGQQLLDISLGDQIVLGLEHAANSTDLFGGFAYVTNGTIGQTQYLGSGSLFHGETFVRTSFFAAQAVPEPGTLALALAGLFGFLGSRRLTRNRAGLNA